MKPTYLLIALVFLPVVYAQITLLSNQTYNYSYVNLSNESVNETFYCEQPGKELFCGLENITMNLTPGVTMIRTGSFNTVTAVCAQNTTTPGINKCVIADNLDAGQDYRVNTDSCDIDLHINQDHTSASSPENVTHEELIDIEFQPDDMIHIVAGNRTIDVDKRDFVSGEKITRRVQFSCPAVIQPEELISDDNVVNTCRTLLPTLASSFVNTSDTCLASMLKTNEIINDRSVDIRSCEESIGDFKAQVSTLQQKLDSEVNTTTTLRTQLGISEASLSSEKDLKELFMFTTILMTFVALFCGYFAFGGTRE